MNELIYWGRISYYNKNMEVYSLKYEECAFLLIKQCCEVYNEKNNTTLTINKFKELSIYNQILENMVIRNIPLNTVIEFSHW